MAWRNCSWVFMTMGPYQATGSSMGLPETSREDGSNAFGAGLDLDFVASVEEDEGVIGPHRRLASHRGRHLTSVSTACGSEASRKVPDPAK